MKCGHFGNQWPISSPFQVKRSAGFIIVRIYLQIYCLIVSFYSVLRRGGVFMSSVISRYQDLLNTSLIFLLVLCAFRYESHRASHLIHWHKCSMICLLYTTHTHIYIYPACMIAIVNKSRPCIHALRGVHMSKLHYINTRQ